MIAEIWHRIFMVTSDYKEKENGNEEGIKFLFIL